MVRALRHRAADLPNAVHSRCCGLRGVTFSSAAVSAEEVGNPIDPRAAATLREAGAIIVAPFVGIKLIDMLVAAVCLA